MARDRVGFSASISKHYMICLVSGTDRVANPRWNSRTVVVRLLMLDLCDAIAFRLITGPIGQQKHLSLTYVVSSYQNTSVFVMSLFNQDWRYSCTATSDVAPLLYHTTVLSEVMSSFIRGQHSSCNNLGSFAQTLSRCSHTARPSVHACFHNHHMDRSHTLA